MEKYQCVLLKGKDAKLFQELCNQVKNDKKEIDKFLKDMKYNFKIENKVKTNM